VRQLVHEDSDLVNRLIHWWIQNLNGLLGGGGTVEGGDWLEEVGPLPVTAPLCFLSPKRHVPSVIMMICLTTDLESVEPGTMN
jgi:hypothetical protein